LDERKHEFVTYSFLERGYRRWGKVTSNPVENVNGAVMNEGTKPILFMVDGLIKYQRDKYRTTQQEATVWENKGMVLTDYGEQMERQYGIGATKCNVKVLEQNHPYYRGRVSVDDFSNSIGYIKVALNVDTKQVQCPCKFSEEIGRN
jgi:hypothetical protein